MNPATTLLNVAIPTYNRAGKLQAQLERLLPQLTEEVRITVYDNASTDETRTTVAKFLHPHILYVCSHTNGGMYRNFLRCFEGCQSEWLWMLSDDDLIAPTAIADLLRLIQNCQADFIHTTAPYWRHQTEMIVENVSQLLYPPFGSLIWISTGIYRISAFRPFFARFNASMSTTIPHLVMVLKLLENKTGKVFFSQTNLLSAPPDISPRWSTLDFITRLSQAPEYVEDPHHKTIVAQCIYNHYYYWALLIGIREVTDLTSIRRWQRARKLSKLTLKAYGAQSPVLDMISPYQVEIIKRRKSKLKQRMEEWLITLYGAWMITVLSWSPSRCFLSVFKWLPKTEAGWDCMHPKNSKDALDFSESGLHPPG